MNEEILIEGSVDEQHRLTAIVPAQVPAGRVKLTLRYVTARQTQSLSVKKKRELLKSIIGSWRQLEFVRLPQDSHKELPSW